MLSAIFGLFHIESFDAWVALREEAQITEPLPLEQGRTRAALVQVRVNQARFRKAVLASYNATCCVSGLRHEKLVIASHIVP